MAWYVLWTETGHEYEMKKYVEETVPSEYYSKLHVLTKEFPRKIYGKWFTEEKILFFGSAVFALSTLSLMTISFSTVLGCWLQPGSIKATNKGNRKIRLFIQ